MLLDLGMTGLLWWLQRLHKEGDVEVCNEVDVGESCPAPPAAGNLASLASLLRMVRAQIDRPNLNSSWSC